MDRAMFIVVLIGYAATDGLGLMQDQLIEDLLNSYDRDAAPITNAIAPLDVKVDFFVQSLQEIDERNQAVSLFLWVGLIWRDVRLSWSPEEYNNVSKVAIHSDRIWTPDVVIRNSLSNMYEYLQNKNFRAAVTNHGLVRYWTGGSLIFSCSLDLTFFPFDTQACYVHLNSWSYDGNAVKLSPVEESVQVYVGSNSQWTILDTNATMDVEAFNTGNEFDSVLYRMLLQRKPAFYTRTIIFPCILLSILALLMFLIPISVGDRISYGITVLLSFTVFQMMIADSLPRTSDQLPFVISYLMTVMILTAACIIFSVVILNLQCQPDDKPLPRWFFILTFKVLSRHSRSSNISSRTRRQDSNDLNDLPNGRKPSLQSLSADQSAFRDTILNWKAAARVWDRFFFVLFGVALLVASMVLLVIYPEFHNVPKSLDDFTKVS